jgi:rhodanese-related sulfurtransferase
MTYKTRKLCASCLKFNFNKTLKNSNLIKPKWLDKIDYVEEFVKNNSNKFTNRHPKNYNKVIKIYIGERFSNRKILYWAAKPSNKLTINGAKKAYGNFSNSGVTTIDENGYTRIKFLVPQNYKTVVKNEKDYTTFFKHIHYVISNKNNTDWNFSIFTKLFHNNYDYKKFLQKLNSKKTIVLNVLPCEYYAKDHIVSTFNLPFSKIKKMSIKELNTWFITLINSHYPKLKKLLNNKLQLNEIPIICYCAHNECSASKNSAEELMKKGFVNVSLYEDGMKGFNKDSKK